MNDELKTFYIPKAKGYRKITTYKSKRGELFKYHSQANISLEKRLKQSIFAKAYIKKRSIITNATAHLYNDIFISMDITDFFQSINHNYLIQTLYYEINKKHIQHFSREQCRNLVISCSNSDIGLAIGLKPSPILANIYLKEFDGNLYGALKKLGLNNIIYTRYADDMVVSYRKIKNYSEENNQQIINLTAALLKKYSLKLNARKTRIIDLTISNHVRITGVNIVKDADYHRSLSVGRKLKKELYQRSISLANASVHDDNWNLEANRLRGLQSFILSVEGAEYQSTYSDGMVKIINEFGFESLKDMIDNFK